MADDDQSVRDLLSALLQTKGHTTVSAGDGYTALDLIRMHEPDLAIIDIGMPHLDGLKLTERVREDESRSHLPIIVVTSRQEPASRYEGFLKGADDYLCKPFDPVELLLRVDALLRRTLRAKTDSQILVVGTYSLDPGRFVFVSRRGEVLMTRSEFSILSCLFRRAGQVVSVEDLLQHALDDPKGVGSPDTVHTHVRNLRHKIEEYATHSPGRSHSGSPGLSPGARDRIGLGACFPLPATASIALGSPALSTFANWALTYCTSTLQAQLTRSSRWRTEVNTLATASMGNTLLAAMSAEARASRTRFVFSRMRKPGPVPLRETKPTRDSFEVEPSRRIEVAWLSSLHKADLLQDPSAQWLDRRALAAKRRLSESVGS